MGSAVDTSVWLIAASAMPIMIPVNAERVDTPPPAPVVDHSGVIVVVALGHSCASNGDLSPTSSIPGASTLSVGRTHGSRRDDFTVARSEGGDGRGWRRVGPVPSQSGHCASRTAIWSLWFSISGCPASCVGPESGLASCDVDVGWLWKRVGESGGCHLEPLGPRNNASHRSFRGPSRRSSPSTSRERSPFGRFRSTIGDQRRPDPAAIWARSVTNRHLGADRCVFRGFPRPDAPLRQFGAADTESTTTRRAARPPFKSRQP